MTLCDPEGTGMKDSLLDIQTLSARLAIPIGSIRNALWRGQAGKTIPVPIRLGRRLRWSEAEIERFLGNRVAAATAFTLYHRLPMRSWRCRPTKREELRRAHTLNGPPESGNIGGAVGQSDPSTQTSPASGYLGKSQ